MVLITPFLLPLIALLPSLALAKRADTAGDFAVTLNGITYNPEAGKSSDGPKKLGGCTGKIQVTGVHVGYDIDCATLAVSDYTLTGAADAMRTSPPLSHLSPLPSAVWHVYPDGRA